MGDWTGNDATLMIMKDGAVDRPSRSGSGIRREAQDDQPDIMKWKSVNGGRSHPAFGVARPAATEAAIPADEDIRRAGHEHERRVTI